MENKTNKLEETADKIATHLEKANFGEYVALLGNPWKFFWINFMAGVMRGVGTAIGITVVFALVVYILATVLGPFMKIPIIGSYIAQLVEFVNRSIDTGMRQ